MKENGQKLDLHAAVVMPDHVHLIYAPLRREDGWSYSVPEIMKAIKGRPTGSKTRVPHNLNRSPNYNSKPGEWLRPAPYFGHLNLGPGS
jgi:REP element-mobilizing transposase RayT